MSAATTKPLSPAQLRGATVFLVEYAPFGGQRYNPVTNDFDTAPDPQWQLCGIFSSKRSAEAYCTDRAQTDEVFARGRYSSQVHIRAYVIR